MNRRTILGALALILSTGSAASAAGNDRDSYATDVQALKQIREGREVFRYNTFGDEDFWGSTLGLRFATLGDVIAHYERVLGFTLSAGERRDLEQYLKSL